MANVGTTGLRVTQVDSYRVTQDFYRTTVTIQNRTNSRKSAILYRGGDCYLNLSDANTKGKLVGSNQPACESTDIAKPEELSLIPISSGSNYHAGDQSFFWAPLDAPEPYSYEDTVVNSAGDTAIDSAVGLSWNVSVRGGDKVVRSNLTKVTIPEIQTVP